MIKMCELCQSIKKIEPVDAEWSTQNQCYETRSYFEDYKPFKGSNQTVRLTCKNFSHIKTAVLNFRGGGRKVMRATPDTPNIKLPGLDND